MAKTKLTNNFAGGTPANQTRNYYCESKIFRRTIPREALKTVGKGEWNLRILKPCCELWIERPGTTQNEASLFCRDLQ